MQRLVFSGGARFGFAKTGGGAWLLRWLSVKIGSSECVKSLQNGLFEEIVARLGGFFLGGAERQPSVFLGGDLKLPMR